MKKINFEEFIGKASVIAKSNNHESPSIRDMFKSLIEILNRSAENEEFTENNLKELTKDLRKSYCNPEEFLKEERTDIVDFRTKDSMSKLISAFKCTTFQRDEATYYEKNFSTEELLKSEFNIEKQIINDARKTDFIREKCKKNNSIDYIPNNDATEFKYCLAKHSEFNGLVQQPHETSCDFAQRIIEVKRSLGIPLRYRAEQPNQSIGRGLRFPDISIHLNKEQCIWLKDILNDSFAKQEIANSIYSLIPKLKD